MFQASFILLLVGALCQTVAGQSTYPFQDVSLSFEDRVDDLVKRLTLQEMQNQMARGGVGDYGGPAPAIPRLGIDAYQWASECVSGDARAQENATAFPEPIGLSATFSPRLLHTVANAIGQEVRGKHNDFVKRGIYATHTGASCFSPVINIVRDPRWGRIEETYGEDPYLSGILAQSYVKGLQGNHSRYVQATAGCKHFDVHGGPEQGRLGFDAKVTDSDWRMTYLPAFRKCVKAGTFSLMCSYNRLNGVPACANKQLLTDILRTEWNFTGYIVSDQQAIENIMNYHHYTHTPTETVAAAVNAGCNLELGNDIAQNIYEYLVDAVNEGKITEATVRERVKPLFYTRMRLGQFDPPDNNPYSKLNNSVVESTHHRLLAVEAASKSFVLLKNLDKTLPLNTNAYKDVSLVGPFSDNYDQLFGDYHANQDRHYVKTPRLALKELYPNLKSVYGCQDGNVCKQYNSTFIVDAITGSDLIFVALGTGTQNEREGTDRPNLELPGSQKRLLQDVIQHGGNAKIVLLLFNAGPLNVTFAHESNKVNAILECFYPGQATGDALVRVLTNRNNSSPAGRLSVTWPRFASQLQDFGNYSMLGRTYRYLKTDPLYPFGYGLSYSTFHYDEISVSDLQSPKQNLNVTLTLSNTGNVDSDEVVQCYIEWGNKSLPVPQRQLVYFDRLHLTAGQTLKHNFQITWDNWAFWENSGWVIQAGTNTLYCGGQQPNQQISASSNVLSIQFNIPSSTKLATL